MKITAIVLSILQILIGIACLFNPLSTAATLTYILAFAMIASGIILCVSYYIFGGSDNLTIFRLPGLWALILGIAMIILGLLLFAMPNFIPTIIAFGFGAWLLINGIVKIVSAVKLRYYEPGWVWSLIFGIISILLGLICFTHMTAIVSLIGIVLGVVLISEGVNMLIMSRYL